MNSASKVDVPIATYNHEAFIGQALDSVLSQRTSFRFRIIVADDCSTDGTPSILRSYKKKYPDKLELILRKKNIGVGYGIKRNGIRLLECCQSEYVALLDGDDYWTDPTKLQKQVDFLDENRGYVLTFHEHMKLHGSSLQKWRDPYDFYNRDRDHGEILWGYIQTGTVMFRNVFPRDYEFKEEFSKVKLGDVYLYAILANYGKAKFLADLGPTIYRIHENGIWSQSDAVWKLKERIDSYRMMRKELSEKTYSSWLFVLMSYHLDLVVEFVRRKNWIGAGKTYIRSLNIALKRNKNLKWFFLFHFGKRYIASYKK